jgi:hypothetical protein
MRRKQNARAQNLNKNRIPRQKKRKINKNCQQSRINRTINREKKDLVTEEQIRSCDKEVV